VKNSTSDLLMNNCDEFIYYDDLARASDTTVARRRRPARKKAASAKSPDRPASAAAKVPSEDTAAGDQERRDEAVDLMMETAEALLAERSGQVWGSMVKQTLKRRRPGFNESYYGFRSFSDLLEEAADRGLLSLELDERSGGYVVRALRHDD